MLNRNFEVLTVNGPLDLTAKDIYAGTPLTLTDKGYKKATNATAFVGLSFNYFSPEKDDVMGGEWFANSGKVGVVKIGQVTIDKDVFEGKEPVYPYDSTKTYKVGDKLFVNAAGLITNEAAAAAEGNINFVGTVTVAPGQATEVYGISDTAMIVFVNASL